MPLDSLESGPERVRSAIGQFYHETLTKHEGEFDAAVLNVGSQEEALLFVLGRIEDYQINYDNREPLGLVRSEITNVLITIEDHEARKYLRDNLWAPALDVAGIEKESFGAFQRIRRAVHLYDSAEIALLMGTIEKISIDADSDK